MADSTITQTSVAHESIDPATSLGAVTLAVADATRSLSFYRDLLGFEVLSSDAAQIRLGAAGVALLELQVQPGLRARPRATSGLYHVAILLPRRVDLAQMLRRLLDARYPLGASDHGVSEALYLSDPDENGLEIYRDRPRATWRMQRDGHVQMAIDPLDYADVLAELTHDAQPWRGLPAGTTIGHIHLQVSDLRAAERFYSDVLGFDVMQRLAPSALFLSAGGYHHHIGLNTWHSAGAPPAPADAAGLRVFVVRLPSAAALAAVQQRIAAAGLPLRAEGAAFALEDPWRNIVRLEVEG